MTALPENDVASNFPAGSSSNCIDRDHTEKNLGSRSSEQISNNVRPSKSVSWSSFLSSFSVPELTGNSSSCEKKGVKHRSYGLASAVKKVMSGGSMRRLQERILGTCKADVTSSTSEIWLLGVCYRLLSDESSSKECLESGLTAFQQDFSSRIWVTYRKGFDAIGESKFTSDVNWGCMIRSSQMLVAQALIYHHLGRSWRRSLEKPHDPKYVTILHLFGDSESSAFSIHNLLKVGVGYGLAAGSWVGPYAMCRSWEVISRADRENAATYNRKQSLPMVLYIVSGDEDGERGGAPVLCVDVASRLCSDFFNGQISGQIPWAPMLLLVPLVLGLDKVNPRYIPLLKATFTFPQSLGIVGGKPGASTYIVGVQDDRALYLDPHEVQLVVDISSENLDADTSSYHCSTVRHLPLEQIDPSLAIGFYCRDKDDFDDFCARASELMESSNGAPLFTITQSLRPSMQMHNSDVLVGSTVGNMEMEEVFHAENTSDCDTHHQEDEWQLL